MPRSSLVAALAAIFLLGVLSTGHAQPKPPKAPPPPTKEQMEKAKAAFLEGRRLIEEEKKYADGVEKFKEAYRLSRNPVLLYNIGFTYDDLIKDKNLALFYYEKFLKDAPANAPNRDLAIERVKVLKREAEADAVFGGSGTGETKPPDGTGETKPPDGTGETKPPDGTGETKPPDGTGETKPPDSTGEIEPPAKPKITKLEHIAIDEAPPSRPLDVTCFIPESARWQVTLYYRAQNENKFNSVPMRPRYNELVGRIPPAKMVGSSLQYYIEARDLAGKLVGQSGRATSPNLVFIDEAAKPRFYPDLGGGGAGDTGAGDTGNNNNGSNSGGAGNLGGGGNIDTTGQKNWKKWGATGAAGGMLALSITFYLLASSASSTLEGRAFESNQAPCPSPIAPPCHAFSNEQKALQDKGKRYEMLSTVTMALGVVGAGVAGWFWYDEYRQSKKGRKAPARTVLVPAIGDDFIGGAAALEF